MTVRSILPLLLVAMTAAACDKSSTEPSSTTTTPTRLTESFETSLARGDSSFYSFTVSNAGSVTVTLASVTQPGQSAPLATALKIGLGTPEGEGCTVTDAVEAVAALTPQLTVTLSAGIHCVKVEDIGQVQGTVLASLRFTHL